MTFDCSHGVSWVPLAVFAGWELESHGGLGGVVSPLGADYVLPTSRHNRVPAVLRIRPDHKPIGAVVTPHGELQYRSGEILPNDSFLRIEPDSFSQHAVTLSTSNVVRDLEPDSSDSFGSFPLRILRQWSVRTPPRLGISSAGVRVMEIIRSGSFE